MYVIYIYIHMIKNIRIYIYIYICVCVCVGGIVRMLSKTILELSYMASYRAGIISYKKQTK